MKIKAKILSDKDIHRVIIRLAHQIIEKNKGAENICILGMRTRGEFLAKRIAKEISKIENINLSVGVLDATLYRDDYRKKLRTPKVQLTDIPFGIDGKNIILVDDVLYTGRSVRAALDEIMDFGRPASIKLVVLIDRGHRELPIQADLIGESVITSIGEEVRVRLSEIDTVDEVLLIDVNSDEIEQQ
jgi:pyrimidine operon attenuation protein/uracil phosphoribosyltransferase